VDRRTQRQFALALIVVVALAAAAAILTGGIAHDPAARQGDQVVGIVTRIEAGGLDKVTSFTLRADDGRQIRFAVGNLENGAEFAPGHLAEHQTTAQKIRVWYQTQNGAFVAYRLEDAE
jgi:hypothetical protein